MTTFVVIFPLLLSLQGFSQTPEKSNHPLLDKYYPQKQNADTNTTITADTRPAITQPSPTQLTKPVPAQKIIVPATDTTTIKSTNIHITVPEAKPIIEPTPTTISQPVTQTTSVVQVTDTTAVNKPINIIPVAPISQKIQKQGPARAPYRDTRLGSSSPLYDTYEKNSNGAGSVTSNPK